MSEERERRKQELREEIQRRTANAIEAARRQVKAGMDRGEEVDAFRIIASAGSASMDLMYEQMDLSPEDMDLIQEINTERLSESIGGASEEVGRFSRQMDGYWEHMRGELEQDSGGLVNIKPKDICILQGTIEEERKCLGGTGLYVIDVDGDELVVCPFESMNHKSGGRTKKSHDVVLRGGNSPLSIFRSSKTIIRPWMVRRISAASITEHPVARLYDHQHGLVLELYHRKLSYRGRPRIHPAWDRAWTSATRRLMAK